MFIAIHPATCRGGGFPAHGVLNTAVQKGSDWSIVKETEIDNYIISAACSSGNTALLAVFEPKSDKGYSFVNST